LPRWLTTTLAASVLLVALPAAALTAGSAPVSAQLAEPEPDRMGDSLALPESERVPAPSGGYVVDAAALAALEGPDAALAARLTGALDRIPRHQGDLVRERAAWALAQTRDGRLIEPLIDALDAPDWRVQSYAAWALASARDPRAVPPLLKLLDHRVWRLRAMAAVALGESADRRAIRPMTAALTDPAWQVRLEAVNYFVSLDDPALAERVRPLRNDRHIAVRRAAQAGVTP
jgi:HEAT repeat protein